MASKAVASGVSGGVRAVGRGTVAAGEAVVDGAKAVASGVASGVQAGAEAVHGAMDRDGDGQLGLNDVTAGVQQAGQAIADGAEAVVDGVQSAGRAIAKGASNLASAAKDEILETGGLIKEGAVAAYERTTAAIKRVGDFLGFYE